LLGFNHTHWQAAVLWYLIQLVTSATVCAGASEQTRGAFLYGVGADYVLAKHWSLRSEYRGFVYEAPSFNLAGLDTDSWTHSAQPSAGIVFRF